MFRWITSFAGSLIINALLLIGGAVYLNFAAPEVDQQPEPILMEIVSDDAAPAAGPQISAPKPEKVDIPPPPTKEEIAQMVKANADTIPVDNKVIDDTPKPPVLTPQQIGNPTQNTTETKGGGSGNDTDVKGLGGNNEKTGLARRATPIYNPAPVLPEIGKNEKIEPSILVQFYVNEQGTVDYVKILESSGNDTVDQSVINTIMGWQYEPELKDNGELDFALITRRIHLDY